MIFKYYEFKAQVQISNTYLKKKRMFRSENHSKIVIQLIESQEERH